MIKVLIAAEIPEIREILEMVVQMDETMGVVSMAATLNQVRQAMRQHQPHITLLDLAMAVQDDFATCRVLHNDTQLVLLAGEAEPELLRQAMQAGAREILLRPLADRELLDAIHRIHNNSHDKQR